MGAITCIKYQQSKHQKVPAILSPLRVENTRACLLHGVPTEHGCACSITQGFFFFKMQFIQQHLKMFPTNEASMLPYLGLLLLF